MTADVLIETIVGNCPVQAEGTLDGCAFYFRARWSAWRFHIAVPGATRDDDLTPAVGAGTCSPGWVLGAPYGDDSAAGWMPLEHVHACIEIAVDSWRAAGRQLAPHGALVLVRTPPAGLP